MKKKYEKLYEEVNEERKKLYLNNGRAIIVLNKIEDRNKIYKELKINECSKFVYHTKKLLGQNTRSLHFYADKIAEPQEILWTYIGETSVSKSYSNFCGNTSKNSLILEFEVPKEKEVSV